MIIFTKYLQFISTVKKQKWFLVAVFLRCECFLRQNFFFQPQKVPRFLHYLSFKIKSQKKSAKNKSRWKTGPLVVEKKVPLKVIQSGPKGHCLYYMPTNLHLLCLWSNFDFIWHQWYHGIYSLSKLDMVIEYTKHSILHCVKDPKHIT